MKNTFYISCPIDTYSGYGARSRDFVKSLIKSEKYDVNILPHIFAVTPFGFIDDKQEPEFEVRDGDFWLKDEYQNDLQEYLNNEL